MHICVCLFKGREGILQKYLRKAEWVGTLNPIHYKVERKESVCVGGRPKTQNINNLMNAVYNNLCMAKEFHVRLFLSISKCKFVHI